MRRYLVQRITHWLFNGEGGNQPVEPPQRRWRADFLDLYAAFFEGHSAMVLISALWPPYFFTGSTMGFLGPPFEALLSRSTRLPSVLRHLLLLQIPVLNSAKFD